MDGWPPRHTHIWYKAKCIYVDLKTEQNQIILPNILSN